MKGRLQLDKNLAGRQNKTLYFVLLYVQWSLYNMDTLGPTKWPDYDTGLLILKYLF